jgi:hypothetical protein
MRMHRQLVSARRILAAAQEACQFGEARIWLVDESRWWQLCWLLGRVTQASPNRRPGRQFVATFDEAPRRQGAALEAGEEGHHPLPLPLHEVHGGWSGP